MASRPAQNVEIKAIDVDPSGTLRACAELGAAAQGLIEQRDTYFATSRGRLKLREELPGEAHLIQYERADVAGEKVSTYRVVAAPQPAALRAALDGALGIRGEVCKRRRLLLWRDVRIHLDEVDGLGSFVELEANVGTRGITEARGLVDDLRRALAITDDRLCAAGYAELLGLR